MNQKMSIADIAQARGLTTSTIMSHIYKLIKEHPDLDIAHLAPDPDLMHRVSTIMDTLTEPGATIIYTALNGEVSYDDIRRCRVFLKR
jgi:hypothetical protein